MDTNISKTTEPQKAFQPDALIRALIRRREFVLVMLIVIMIIFLSSISPAFLSYRNMMALASNEAIKGFVVISVMMLLVTREFDLSVGAGMSLVGVVMAWVIAQSGNLALGILAGLVTGLLLGFINGFLVTRLRMASFIATLGTLYMSRSLCNVITQGKAIPVQNQWIIDFFNSYFIGLPSVFVWMIVVAVVMSILLGREKRLRRLFYTGVNERGAEMVGINTRNLRWMLFIFSGFMIAIAGIAYTGMLRSAVPLAFSGLEMKLIAMAIIGGASLKGGQGSVIGAILGLLLLTLIGNSMTLLGISPQWEGTILGSILLGASILDVYIQRKTA